MISLKRLEKIVQLMRPYMKNVDDPIETKVEYFDSVKNNGEIVVEQENSISLNKDYSDYYTYDEWKSLVYSFKGTPNFRQKVRSSSNDVTRNVFVIGEEVTRSFDTSSSTDNISFVEISDRFFVRVNVLNSKRYKDSFIKKYVECLLTLPLEEMPLYINDKDPLIKKIVAWRFKVGDRSCANV